MYAFKGITFSSFQRFFWQSISIVIICNIIVTQQLFAQFTDSFSDADFSNNPSWAGTDTKFSAALSDLKLQAPAVADFAFLSTASQSVNDASWEFDVRMDFNPSSSNFARIYLVSSVATLNDQLDGYFVMVGNTSDEVSLYQQTGLTKTKIIDGVDARVNLSIVNVRVKVTRDASGLWTLYSDVGQTGTYNTEGQVTDLTHQTSEYFGVYCEYTSTRSDKFHFDNIEVSGQGYIDDIPPTIQSLTVSSSKEISIQFSETISSSTATVVSNYMVIGGTNPIHAELTTEHTVTLQFAAEFSNGTSTKIDVSGIQDIAGNQMLPASQVFVYFHASPLSYKDVILTEVFPDFSPSIGLPDAEFVELFNRSANPIQLKDWRFADQTSVGLLPEKILLPGEYVIITASASVSLYNGYGTCLSSSRFPSLNNDGDILVLKSAEGILIDSIAYTDSWYQDSEASEGGVTLELIDPENICAVETNWAASESETGGTPGKQNSINEQKPDLTAPVLVSVTPLDANTIVIKFSEKLSVVVPSTNSFQINPGVTIKEMAFTDQSLTELLVTLSSPLASSTLYEVTIANIADCAGNLLEEASAQIALPESALPGDVVLNEILFNPFPSGVDFVEVYNKSNKYINLKSLQLANLYDTAIANVHSLSDADVIFLPHTYKVFTTDVDALSHEFPLGIKENFHQVSSLPSMPDDDGAIVLLDHSTTRIDALTYSKTMHSIYIKDDEGVSLERISFEAETNKKENWKSASSTSGYGTPGYVNSNSKQGLQLTEKILVSPKVIAPFSADRNFTLIQYDLDKGGWVANVTIYDQQGRTIKTVAENTLLGAQGFLRWDGDDDSGQKARVGYYMIYFEIFDDAGNTQIIRESVAIAGQF
jgi:hypothetical protein